MKNKKVILENIQYLLESNSIMLDIEVTKEGKILIIDTSSDDGKVWEIQVKQFKK